MPPLSDRTKKLLIAILGLAIVLGIAVAVYVAFFRASAPPAVIGPGTGTVPGGSLPNAGQAQPGTTPPVTTPGTLPNGGAVNVPGAEPSRTQTLVESSTSFASLDTTAGGEGMRFYNPADGKFYRVNDLGELTAISDKAFYNVETVSWGKSTDQAILEFPDGSNVLYNFTQNRQVTLPKHWEDFQFGPNDGQIVAKSMGNNESSRFLVISNADGSDARAIQELGDNGDKVETAWAPNNQIVAVAHTGDAIGFDREQIVLIGKNQENLPGLITEGRGFIPAWSPQGNTLLYSVYTSENGYLPEIWLSGGTAETINSNRRRLELNTWADKCAWSSETIVYCAVPSSLQAGAGLQREGTEKGPDQIFRVDLSTNQKTNLGPVDNMADVKTLTISTDQRTAYALDRANGQIARFDLTR